MYSYLHVTYLQGDYTTKAFSHGYGRMSACQRQQLIRIEDVVAVTLLGQKQLAVVGKIQLLGIARDDGVEVGRTAIGLGAQNAAEALGLLLARSKRARDLDEQICIGQIERKV